MFNAFVGATVASYFTEFGNHLIAVDLQSGISDTRRVCLGLVALGRYIRFRLCGNTRHTWAAAIDVEPIFLYVGIGHSLFLPNRYPCSFLPVPKNTRLAHYGRDFRANLFSGVPIVFEPPLVSGHPSQFLSTVRDEWSQIFGGVLTVTNTFEWQLCTLRTFDVLHTHSPSTICLTSHPATADLD